METLLTVFPIQSRSAPMKEILQRLEAQNFYEIIIFTNDMLFNETIEQWPRVDWLVDVI